ncbi:UNKNOWN [Stylonychia lemnae]|uniref:Uncharacterized protein n=1 Tax=Stylonychia lemnae TaxID=5949 RepID=A0A078A5F6_STYLE|nr:UNKNOWN [Stylonychia lemnae]|eukprot:CDW75989.1 UNKNOWN [Stylonychia lemnae]
MRISRFILAFASFAVIAQVDCSDIVSQSLIALFGISNFQNTLNHNFLKDNSDLIYAQTASMLTTLPFIATQGYAYAMQDQDSDLSFTGDYVTANQARIQEFKNFQFGIYQGIVTNTGNRDCANLYTEAYQVLKEAHDALNNIIEYQTIGYLPALKDTFRQACQSNGMITCISATEVLLRMLNGDIQLQSCDIPKMFYDKDPTESIRGWKNYQMLVTAHTLYIATLGIGMSAASNIIESNDPNQWLKIQDRFQLQIVQAVKRIRSYYEQALSETMMNAQLMLVNDIKRDDYQSQNLQDIVSNASLSLNLFFNQKKWFIQAYSNQAGIQSSKCQDCFYLYNVNQTYNIFVAAVDSTSAGNMDIINKNWLSLIQQATDKTSLVNTAFNSDCLFGITATDLSANQAWSFPDNWKGYRQITNQYQVLLWSVQGRCPKSEG